MKKEGRIVVGIVGWKVGENSFGATSTYLEYISKLGCSARILMPWEEKAEDIDVLLLPGGADINPNSFGQVPGYFTSNTDVMKQYFYDNRLQLYIDAKVPIFGICLGFQQLCSKFGVPVEQNLLFHPSSEERWEPGHEIEFSSNAARYCTKVPSKAKVNSHHHQGVLVKNLVGSQLEMLAFHEGVAEAVIHRELPIAGVQHHPEEWYDTFSQDLFLTILKRGGVL